MILLDTNVISENFRVNPNRLVLDWINSQTESNLYLCAPVVAELRFGAERLAPGRKQTNLLAALNQAENYFSGRILPFDIGAVAAYGRLMVKHEQMGRRIELMDALIAAIALTNGAAVATRDTRDFADLGLDLINPFEALAT
jgi:predicted nucleic acid-binding protein